MAPTNAAAIAKHARYTGTIDGFARATRLMIAPARPSQPVGQAWGRAS